MTYLTNPLFITALILAYMIGSIPFGKIIVRLKAKKDIQKFGSGNIGATNVSRILGRRWAVLCFVLDFLKGFIVTFASLWIFLDLIMALSVGLAVLIGHIFSIYLRFKGGKGVATASGILFVFIPFIIIFSGFFQLLILSQTKIMSIAFFSSLAICSVLSFFLAPIEIFYFVVIFGSIIVFSHRDNIKRLIAGNEIKLKP